MKYSHIMEEVKRFESNHPLYMIEKQEPKFSFWDLVLTIIFLGCFFGCIFLYLENRTLKIEVDDKHKLIMDMSKLLERKLHN